MKKQTKMVKDQLKDVFQSYYLNKFDDYFEAKDAFILEINAALSEVDKDDLGVICKNHYKEVKVRIENLIGGF